MKTFLYAGLAGLGLLLAPPATAEEFPAGQPIEITVMFGAGSAADVTARQLADGMSKRLKTPVTIVNRTGGGGASGYTYVSQQRPNGYSLVWNSNSISTTHHSGTLGIDYTAFTPVAQVSIETPVLAVRDDAPWKTLDEFMAFVKENPGKVRIGNSGAGSHTHLVGSALIGGAGGKAIEVPFNQGQAIVNLLGKRIEAIIQLPAAILPQIKSGNVRVLAALGAKRDPSLPDVSTAEELGSKVSLEMWRGVAAPKGTPKEVVDKLDAAIKETVASPEFVAAGKTVGFTPAYLPAAEFGEVIARDDRKLGDVMAGIGMKKQ